MGASDSYPSPSMAVSAYSGIWTKGNFAAER
jgi:hypothetical protein